MRETSVCLILLTSHFNLIVGVDDVEGPPVPMPNTEVKLDGAENTRMVTSREDRKMPTQRPLLNGLF